eukprot:Transcript_13229.p2 GENE.Transcript_13229~~Transcript_13229.p2  ORF type:complete len:300 (-),score=53.92 Transcript_13229:31-930(-)
MARRRRPPLPFLLLLSARPAAASFPCYVHKSCQECGADPACGWCAGNSTASSGTCLPAREGVQIVSAGGRTCPAAQWKDKQCGGNPDVCGSYKSCIACAKNLHCGWCAGGGLQPPHCALGNPVGPSRGQCSYWQHGFCTDSDGDCKADLSCEVCARRRGCGYNRRRGACEVAAAARGSLITAHNYRVCSSGSFEADHKQHTDEGWATPALAGPVTNPYALDPGPPTAESLTQPVKPVAVVYKGSPPDPPVEMPRGCRYAGDPRGVDPRNVPVDCKLGFAVADRGPAPSRSMAPMEFGQV